MSSLDYLSDRLVDLDRDGLLRRLVPRRSRGVRLIEPDGRELINFGGNDYLGLATDDRATARDVQPIARGSAASSLVCGWSDQHQHLADQIARLEGTESAVLFPTGFAACMGTVATLAEEGDLILSDELNHASLIDGCRLSKATRLVYPHRDVATVDRLLSKRRDEFARVWILTDGVFSMDGHVAPLRPLCDLADRHRAHVLVDEAHATGVLGKTGSGLCEEAGVKDRVSVRIGTLSKAIGSQGGFVAGPQVVIDYLVNRCRSLIFSTALAPAAVSAASDAFEIIRQRPERRDRVHALSRRIRDGLSIKTGELESKVPIIPVPIGDEGGAVEKSLRLAEAGFFVPAIRPPTVPPGGARLRISVSAAHEETTVDRLITALRGVLATG